MSEQERIDRLLRQAMSASAPPMLSSSFEDGLAKRLRPRRLNTAGRLLLACYALAALTISIWAMRSHSIDWSLIVAAVAVPLVITATICRRHLYPAL